MTDRETILEIAKAKQREIHGPVSEKGAVRIERKASVKHLEDLRHGSKQSVPPLSDHRIHPLKPY